MRMFNKIFGIATSLVIVIAIIGEGTSMSQQVSGSTAGSTSQNEDSMLESCAKPLGTVSLFEDQSLTWWHDYYRRYPNLGTTIPVIRMMVQQSNCFVVVERGKAMEAMQRERALMSSGELRSNSNFGKGQMVAADYTLSPSVSFKKSKIGKISGVARGFLKKIVPVNVGGVGVDSSEASTTLLLLDNRSGVQVSAAVGSAKKLGFNWFGSSWSQFGSSSVSAFSNTDEGKVIMSAFADSYNQMVKALRNYKPQVVDGGLGAGGALTIDGATNAVAPATTTVTASNQETHVTATHSNVNVKQRKNLNVTVDAYDEDALDDYYKALKTAVSHLSTFASFTEPQLEVLKQQSKDTLFGLLWLPGFSGQMDTAKIELESWPLQARQEGWSIIGKKIKKYNKLFYKYRDMILENNGYDQTTKDRLAAVTLVTEESILSY